MLLLFDFLIRNWYKAIPTFDKKILFFCKGPGLLKFKPLRFGEYSFPNSSQKSQPVSVHHIGYILGAVPSFL